ncbi:MAG: hypothetical protein U0559_17585 [Anaerolineae bacterium]
MQDIADRATLTAPRFICIIKTKHDLLVKSLHDAIDELIADINTLNENGQLVFEGPEGAPSSACSST